MSEEMFAVYCWLGFVGGLALVCFVICKVMNFVDKKKNQKHHKEYPEFFRLREDFSEKAGVACRFYNNEIAPRKCKVDYMLKEEPYWPQEVWEQKMEEVEKLRREIYTAECMYKGLNKDMDEARQKVVEYVQAHGFKWAGVWE